MKDDNYARVTPNIAHIAKTPNLCKEGLITSQHKRLHHDLIIISSHAHTNFQ